jgi:phosphoribosylformylglycinamidine (FGAM) synthase PurS component
MAKHTLHVTVGLKVTDNEARSALEALQEKMGLRDRVSDLTREELWEIEVESDRPSDARETVERLVATTNLFANPNKHKYAVSDAAGDSAGDRAGEAESGGGESSGTGGSGEGNSGAVSSGGGSRALSPNEVIVLVADREGTEGESVLSAIRRIGIDDVSHVRRWTRWCIQLKNAPERGDPEALALIRRIGVATGRRDGLLSNPHSQVSRAILPWGEEKVLAA